MKGSKIIKISGWILFGILLAAGLGLVFGIIVMGLWNWLMPTLFGLPEIGYWQAVGIFILCHLLFKGPHPHGHGEPQDEHSAHFRSRVKGFMKSHIHDIPDPDKDPPSGSAPAPHSAT